MRSIPLLALLLATCLANPASAEWTPGPLVYAKIALDADDHSHFADVQEPFEMKDFAPPAGPIGLSALRNTSTLVFATSDASWVGDWHPTPRVQYILVLSGSVEITVEDGEKRRFDPGSVLLLEDIRGKGHASKVVSDTPALFAIVALGEAP